MADPVPNPAAAPPAAVPEAAATPQERHAMVTLPDGKRARITFTDRAQLDATVADLVKVHGKPAGPAAPKPEQPNDSNLHPFERGLEEAAANIGSSAIATPVAGLAGIARGATSLVKGEGVEAATRKAAETVQGTQEALTYQPKTPVGQAVSGAVAYPFRKLAEVGQKAGDYVQEKTGSPLLATAADTAVQFAPAIVGKGVGLVRGAAAGAEELAARGAAVGESGPAAPRGTTAKPAGSSRPDSRTPPGATPPPRPATSGAPGATSAPPGATTAPPRQTAGEAPGAAQPGPAPSGGPTPAPGAAPTPGGPTPESATTPDARAQAYARRIGLDWSQLGAGVRKSLETIAQDARALEALNPEVVKRKAVLEGLRIPVQATRGQLTRDPVQLRAEAVASNTSEGQPIRDVDIAANRDLQANLEVLRGRVGGLRGGLHEPVTEAGEAAPTPSIRAPTKTQTEVGEAAQKAAREKAKWSKKGYQALYKMARETEPTAEARVAPLQQLLTSNPEIQHLGWLSGWLNKARSVKGLEGDAPLESVTLNELHDLRSKAGDIARTGGKEGHYASQVVKAVDEAMQDVPEGAAAWKRANDAFRKHQQEFKDQGIVQRLTSQKKGGADRQLALEKTWKTIATGPLEQIRQVKKTLLTGGDPLTRSRGRAAWRQIRAETVNRILEDARNVTTADETERAVLTEAALRRSIARIPRENLEELIGKANTRELMQILRARRITTRSPVGGRTTQSGTVPNTLVLAEKVLKHLGPVGRVAVGAKHALGGLAERGRAAQAAQEATVSPLEQAARDVERARSSRLRRLRESVLGPAGQVAPGGAAPQPAPQPTIQDALKRPPPGPTLPP